MTQDDGDEVGGTEDRRRAKLADIHRLEAAVAKAEGTLAAMEKAPDRPISKTQFYNLAFPALLAADGARGIKFIRRNAAYAYSEYLLAVAGADFPSMDEVYGGQPADAAKMADVSVTAGPATA